MQVWRNTRSKGSNSTFLYSCFVCLVFLGVLANCAKVSIHTVDDEVYLRKGGLLTSKKVPLILAGKVYFHYSYHPMVIKDGLFRSDADYDHIAVCEGSVRGKDLSNNTRLFTYFACPMDSTHTGGFAAIYCCKKPPSQECCWDTSFGFEHDNGHKKVIIIVCSIIGSLLLICIGGVVACCVCGFSVAGICCCKTGGGGSGGASGGRSILPGAPSRFPGSRPMPMNYQTNTIPPLQQGNTYQANQYQQTPPPYPATS